MPSMSYYEKWTFPPGTRVIVKPTMRRGRVIASTYGGRRDRYRAVAYDCQDDINAAYWTLEELELLPDLEPPPQPQETEMHTNFSTAIFLYNDKVRAVLCSYDPGATPALTQKTMFKTLDTSIKEGDLVIVPTDTRHRFTIVRVENVDVEPDLETGQEVKWIAGVFDRAPHERNLELEAQATSAIKEAHRAQKRRELAKGLMGAAHDKLAGLDIVTVPPPALTDGTNGK